MEKLQNLQLNLMNGGLDEKQIEIIHVDIVERSPVESGWRKETQNSSPLFHEE